MTIHLYDVHDSDDTPVETGIVGFFDAKVRAQVLAKDGGPHAVIDMEYEFADSSLVFTTDGSDVWPSA